LIRNAQDPRFFGGIKRKPTDPKHEGMDPYPAKDLPDADLKALVEYCLSLSGEEAAKAAHVDAALAKKGADLWESGTYNCSDCHEVTEGETGDAPNLLGHGSKAWLVKTITNSSANDLFGKDAKMPKFGQKLTPEQMGQLADYIIESAQKPNN
jgi:mono/diheme cytochrome c family protein